MNENEIRDVLGEGIGEEPPVIGGPEAVFAAARTRVVRTRVVTGASGSSRSVSSRTVTGGVG